MNQEKTHYLYFVQSGNGGAVKIGVTHDLPTRFRMLQNGNPNKLHLLMKIPFSDREAALKAEKYWHNLFYDKRLIYEWFDVTPREVFQSFAETGDRYVVGEMNRRDIMNEGVIQRIDRLIVMLGGNPD